MTERATALKLQFINLLNGITVEEVAKAFHKSTLHEVRQDFSFVALKIKSYLFQRAMPYIAMDTIEEARQNRIVLLTYVEKVNLDILPIYSSIKAQPLESILQ